MNINDIYLFVQDILLNKLQSGEFTDDMFNEAIAFTNIDLFRKETGLEQDYEPGRPIPRVGWQLSNTISDNLRNFIVTVDIPVSALGYFPYPTDYGIFSTMEYVYALNPAKCGGKPTYEIRTIEPLTDNELKARKSSRISPPKLYRPIMGWNALGYDVYPKLINRVKLTYLQVPVTPFRAFTPLSNDETQYDPANSIQIAYPQALYTDFAVRVCRYFGVNLRAEEIVGFMENRLKTGE